MLSEICAPVSHNALDLGRNPITADWREIRHESNHAPSEEVTNKKWAVISQPAGACWQCALEQRCKILAPPCNTAVLIQKAVTAHLKSKQLLLTFQVNNCCILALRHLFYTSCQYGYTDYVGEGHVLVVNPIAAKLFNLNFHPLEVVSRWRDPQLQVSENYSDLINWGQLFSNLAGWCHILSLTYLKRGT